MPQSAVGSSSKAPLRAALGLVAGAIVLCFTLSVGRPLSGTLRVVGSGLTLVTILGIWACLHRARLRPEEALGWRLAALSQMVYGAPILGYIFATDNVALAVRLSSLNILHFLILLAGILAWPWQDRRRGRWLLHGLGSLLFSGSILFALWGGGAWSTAVHSGGFLNHLVLVNALRITLVGGLILFLISEQPRRARGPLGWLLANMVAAGTIGSLAQMLIQAGVAQALPFGALAILAPASVLLSALSPHPVEPQILSIEPECRWNRRWETLPYLPFGLASITLVWVTSRHAGALLGTLVAYIGLTTLLVLRQILLLSELKAANRNLDERVRQRTVQLENLQETVLRTERMNAMAVLGAGLVHDLNNALSVVYGALDLAPPSPGGDGNLNRRALCHVRETLDRVSALGARLMAFARQKEEPLEPLDLGREISELQGLLRMALPAQVRLEVLLPKEPLWILSAPGHLEQILMNLVINARDALPRGGMVRVRVALEGSPGAEAACVSVEDTGTGMSQEVLDQLFTPFFTTKGVGKGTGLGLASVKTLVERNGGTIHVQSAPETGTTFRLCFPVTPAMAGVGTDG